VTAHSSRGGTLWSSRGIEVVVTVCATCNHGWMSDLESEFAAAFLIARIGPCNADPRDQKTW
jgi:hypothetical protein